MDATTLQTSILNAFLAMNDMTSGGDTYCANELAKAIDVFIKTGVVSTTDSGTVSGAEYSGHGTGSMSINVTSLESDLYDAFTAENLTNDTLADGIATAVHDACTASNTIKTSTSGTIKTSSGSSSYSGTGKGTFSGTKATISKALKTAFESMNSLTSGGNEVFAAALATSISAYFLAGSVSVTLDTPIVGSGSGKIA